MKRSAALAKIFARGLALASVLGEAAHAEVIYQSIPNLTVAPTVNAFCSQCSGDGFDTGQAFSLSNSAIAQSISFDVQNNFFWPTSVTVAIYDQGPGSTVGSLVYSQTFSSFASMTNTGNATDVVTVNVGNLALASGSYLLFLYNPSNLGIPGYASSGSGSEIFVSSATPNPTVGQTYGFDVGYNAGVSINGTIGTTPLPAALPLFATGLGALGLLGWRRKRKAQAVA
jgi:hypothetical protein